MPSRGTETQAQLRASHTPGAIRRRLSARRRHSNLSDFIYGAVDGTVTTFAVVSGVAGASLGPAVIIVLGAANLIADGFSMAAANFLGVRAEQQQRQRARQIEEREIRLHPEGEREEIRQIYAGKGFEGETLAEIVRVMTADRDRWVDTMMTEEHGASAEPRSAWRAAGATFVAFIVIGAIPLLPFLPALVRTDSPVDMTRSFFLSAMMTGAAFFVVGALKSRFVDQRWWLSGLETLGVGGVAAGLAYGAGVLLHDVAAGA